METSAPSPSASSIDDGASAPYDPGWNGERLIPKRVVIETVFGCNAKCAMCVIDHPTERAKGIMPRKLFRRIVDALAAYKDQVEMVDLFGLGEPLLDPWLCERIRYVREKGFRNLAISTNAHLLTREKQGPLLESGIETVIFSIDGARKETHEAIRARVNFERVVENCTETIRLRDRGGYETRFIIRFIRQEKNWHEWEPFRAFWTEVISADKGDRVTCFNMHNWSGAVGEKSSVLEGGPAGSAFEAMPCHHIFEKLVILADGSVALCFEDVLEAAFGFGNVKEDDPVALFNGPRFNKIRRLHVSGKRTHLKLCGQCTVLHNEQTRV